MENFDACLKQYTEEVWQVIQSYLGSRMETSDDE